MTQGQDERGIDNLQDPAITSEFKCSEEWYKVIFEYDPDAYYLRDLDGKLIDVNKTFEELTDYKKEDIIGKTIYELEILPSDEAYQIKSALAKRPLGTLIGPKEHTLTLKYGKEVIVELRNFLIEIYGEKLILGIIRDITQRKESEERLLLSEERYRALAQSAVDGIITTNVHGDIIFFNDSLLNIFGYTTDNIKGKNLTILMPERFRSDFLASLDEFKSTGEHTLAGKTVETTGMKKDGTEFPFEMSLSYWKVGNKTYFTSIIRDITSRKKYLNELKRTHAHLENAMDLANLVTWEFDSKTMIFTFNDRFYAMYGTTAEQEGGYKVSADDYVKNFVHPEDAPPVAEGFRQTMETGELAFPEEVEHRIIRRDGETRYIVVHISPIYDDEGNLIGSYGANQDITERKKAEEAVHESEDKYRTIFENSGTAVAFIEENSVLSLVNKEFENLSGYSKEEVEGKMKFPEFVSTHEEKEQMLEYHRMRRTDPENAPHSYEFQFKDKKDSIKDVIVTVSMIPGKNESLASLIDITERKKAEKALKISEEKYRRIVEKILKSLTEIMSDIGSIR